MIFEPCYQEPPSQLGGANAQIGKKFVETAQKHASMVSEISENTSEVFKNLLAIMEAINYNKAVISQLGIKSVGTNGRILFDKIDAKKFEDKFQQIQTNGKAFVKSINDMLRKVKVTTNDEHNVQTLRRIKRELDVRGAEFERIKDAFVKAYKDLRTAQTLVKKRSGQFNSSNIVKISNFSVFEEIDATLNSTTSQDTELARFWESLVPEFYYVFKQLNNDPYKRIDINTNTMKRLPVNTSTLTQPEYAAIDKVVKQNIEEKLGKLLNMFYLNNRSAIENSSHSFKKYGPPFTNIAVNKKYVVTNSLLPDTLENLPQQINLYLTPASGNTDVLPGPKHYALGYNRLSRTATGAMCLVPNTSFFSSGCAEGEFNIPLLDEKNFFSVGRGKAGDSTLNKTDFSEVASLFDECLKKAAHIQTIVSNLSGAVANNIYENFLNLENAARDFANFSTLFDSGAEYERVWTVKYIDFERKYKAFNISVYTNKQIPETQRATYTLLNDVALKLLSVFQLERTVTTADAHVHLLDFEDFYTRNLDVIFTYQKMEKLILKHVVGETTFFENQHTIANFAKFNSATGVVNVDFVVNDTTNTVSFASSNQLPQEVKQSFQTFVEGLTTNIKQTVETNRTVLLNLENIYNTIKNYIQKGFTPGMPTWLPSHENLIKEMFSTVRFISFYNLQEYITSICYIIGADEEDDKIAADDKLERWWVSSFDAWNTSGTSVALQNLYRRNKELFFMFTLIAYSGQVGHSCFQHDIITSGRKNETDDQLTQRKFTLSTDYVWQMGRFLYYCFIIHKMIGRQFKDPVSLLDALKTDLYDPVMRIQTRLEEKLNKVKSFDTRQFIKKFPTKIAGYDTSIPDFVTQQGILQKLKKIDNLVIYAIGPSGVGKSWLLGGADGFTSIIQSGAISFQVADFYSVCFGFSESFDQAMKNPTITQYGFRQTGAGITETRLNSLHNMAPSITLSYTQLQDLEEVRRDRKYIKKTAYNDNSSRAILVTKLTGVPKYLLDPPGYEKISEPELLNPFVGLVARISKACNKCLTLKECKAALAGLLQGFLPVFGITNLDVDKYIKDPVPLPPNVDYSLHGIEPMNFSQLIDSCPISMFDDEFEIQPYNSKYETEDNGKYNFKKFEQIKQRVMTGNVLIECGPEGGVLVLNPSDYQIYNLYKFKRKAHPTVSAKKLTNLIYYTTAPRQQNLYLFERAAVIAYYAYFIYKLFIYDTPLSSSTYPDRVNMLLSLIYSPAEKEKVLTAMEGTFYNQLNIYIQQATQTKKRESNITNLQELLTRSDNTQPITEATCFYHAMLTLVDHTHLTPFQNLGDRWKMNYSNSTIKFLPLDVPRVEFNALIKTLRPEEIRDRYKSILDFSEYKPLKNNLRDSFDNLVVASGQKNLFMTIYNPVSMSLYFPFFDILEKDDGTEPIDTEPMDTEPMVNTSPAKLAALAASKSEIGNYIKELEKTAAFTVYNREPGDLMWFDDVQGVQQSKQENVGPKNSSELLTEDESEDEQGVVKRVKIEPKRGVVSSK